MYGIADLRTVRVVTSKERLDELERCPFRCSGCDGKVFLHKGEIMCSIKSKGENCLLRPYLFGHYKMNESIEAWNKVVRGER